MAGDPLIELRDVDKYFGDLHVLRDVGLTVDRGEVVVVIGPSRSGRSTPCRAINRLETVRSGTILLDGQPLPYGGKAPARLRADVGMVFQSFDLFAHRTVLQNVPLGQVKVRGRKKEDADRRSHALLGRVGVAGQADKYPARLPGGRQPGVPPRPSGHRGRAAIARAPATEPKVMRFDEPTSAPDPERINEVLEVMRQLAGEGMTVIVVTHGTGFARPAADRAVFMADGRIVEDRTPDGFLGDPRSDRAKDSPSEILEH
ncbi:glutamate ABC transporter ATP-binding protein [Streptomyces sp. 13-12-16]|uniref:amino acid ABC transporter ATP-binding protein n=1 Tax=Streptomyces sp. 13-12-16 TaxID=1570823 RepID=UPI000A1D83BE|nr:amino acid ABC transporter ATP-binding protein [Streptomyces sp. 13-12-16]OSP28371.1 glutamate ABC transporter ATP-binding protein [Streptomyces sp. 13-12-16]